MNRKPVIGLALRHKTGANTWVGALIAMAGLYYLSVTEEFTIGYGDLLPTDKYGDQYRAVTRAPRQATPRTTRRRKATPCNARN